MYRVFFSLSNKIGLGDGPQGSRTFEVKQDESGDEEGEESFPSLELGNEPINEALEDHGGEPTSVEIGDSTFTTQAKS